MTAFPSFLKEKGSVAITPYNYKNLLPLNQMIYSHRSGFHQYGGTLKNTSCLQVYLLKPCYISGKLRIELRILSAMMGTSIVDGVVLRDRGVAEKELSLSCGKDGALWELCV